MAASTLVYKFINGAASATLATAISNANTAISTFMANANSAVFNPAYQPQMLNSGVAVAPDAAVANDQYMAWVYVSYYSVAS